MKITRIEITLNDGTLIFCSLDEARELLAELKALLEPPTIYPLAPIMPYPIQPWTPPTNPGDGTGTITYPNTSGTIVTSGLFVGKEEVKP